MWFYFLILHLKYIIGISLGIASPQIHYLNYGIIYHQMDLFTLLLPFIIRNISFHFIS